MTDFLFNFDDRLPWKKTAGAITSHEILRGNEETGLTIVVAESSNEPTKSDMQSMWKSRTGQSADPVLLFVLYPAADGSKVTVLGPDRTAVPVSGIELALAERLAERALEMESPTGLVVELRRRLGSLQGGIGPGFRNEGLFASHILSQQPDLPQWSDLCARSESLLHDRGEKLLKGLGYKVEHVADGVVLRDDAGGNRRAAAVLLLNEESFDNPLGRFAGTNAVAHGLALARRENVPWLILLGGSVARLFPADPDVGVGRKGQTQTFAEVDLDLLSDSTAGYLTLLFSPEALSETGTVALLLAESSQYATALSDRLRDRIYEDVIPSLATAVAARNKVWDVAVEDQKVALEDSYHEAMIILFRMLFVAYAEDRGLLPLGVNDAYTANALKTLAQRMLDEPDKGFSETSTSLWKDLTQIWEVIDTGDLEGMGVPAYNGGLFTQDSKKNPLGAATFKLNLKNSEIGPVIKGLMIDQTTDGFPGLVDFRSLDVREFGTIYEGLLESGLAIADSDLTVDAKETFVPAGKADEVIVERGSVYFHSRSGSRKATGSYFTKPFAVQHLLDQALEPALDTHLERVKDLLKKGATKSAAEALFDFRVADLSMGSAHFLVAAVDRIEARFSAFIAENPMPEVLDELHKLRTTAAMQLGLAPGDSGIDDGVLLRRQIARRCIYGIDINEIAVELARLAIWIHTFVPGLPLSFLDHGLIHGNSLTGVGTLQEVSDAMQQAQENEDRDYTGVGMFDVSDLLIELLSRADIQLGKLAAISGASISEVDQVQELYEEVNVALRPLTALCDLITAERTTRKLRKTDPDKFLIFGGTNNNVTSAVTAEELETAILRHPQLTRAQSVARQVDAAHMPTRFPEVFRRDPSGFDVILGNPPWEVMHLEENVWWGLHMPGYRSLPKKDQVVRLATYRKSRTDLEQEFQLESARSSASRGVIHSGPYPGLGSGHIDLYQAFAWRNWQLLRDRGKAAIVLPRMAMSSSGLAPWRREVLLRGGFENVAICTNKSHWLFDGVHGQYSIVLVAFSRNVEHSVSLSGPFMSQKEFEEGSKDSLRINAREFLSWSSTSALPSLPSLSALKILQAMRQSPEIFSDREDFAFAPIQGDVNAANDKALFDFQVDASARSMPVLAGSAFNLWDPGFGKPYALADDAEIRQFLAEKFNRSRTRTKSAYSGFSEFFPQTLPIDRPRIAWRNVTNQTNSRTGIFCLLPPGVVATHGVPLMVNRTDSIQSEAFLLGVLSSIPFDWYARRWVELNFTFEIFSPMPVPVFDSGTPTVDRIVEIAGRLGAVDQRYSEWAQAVGVPVGSAKTQVKRDALLVELDALVSLLYGLSRDQVEQVFATFHRGWDYKPRLAVVLTHFDRWTDLMKEAS